jgi:hypothetical protein
VSFTKQIYDKVLKGDALTDHEVYVGIQAFGTLAHDLGQLGDTFKLQAAELRRVEQLLRDFQQARFEMQAMKNLSDAYNAILGDGRRRTDS